jgi:hypothetical protein
VVRLAAILALLAWSEQDSPDTAPLIGHATLLGAIELWQSYFWPHTRTVFQRAGRTDRDRHARRVVRWLRDNRFATVTREEMRREGLNQAVDALETDRVAARLEEAGVLRLDTVTRQGRGRPARRWTVNRGCCKHSRVISRNSGYSIWPTGQHLERDLRPPHACDHDIDGVDRHAGAFLMHDPRGGETATRSSRTEKRVAGKKR